MIEFEAALARITAEAGRLDRELVELADADGRVLAEALTADTPMPRFDYSAMDGYAVASATFAGEGPWQLSVSGESRTGQPAPALVPKTACRIFTGAELPSGADAVVLQEDVERLQDRVLFKRRPRALENVRLCGEDLAAGAVALGEGTRLGPSQLALAAALDRPRLCVSKRPRVRIVCTGDELRRAGEPARPATIPESNGIALAAFARRAGALAELTPLVNDSKIATVRAITDALEHCDLLVTVGGASVGDYDVVRSALETAGVTLHFHKVNIKPGKPLMFGSGPSARVIGLPGNPISAQVTFALFGMPLLRAMQGDSRPLPPRRSARLLAPIQHKPGRHGFYRARCQGNALMPLDNQASGALISMAWADALVHVPADSDGFAPGDSVDLFLLSEL